MRIRTIGLWTAFVWLLFGPNQGPGDPTKTIGICDGTNEWPPYTYFERMNGKKTDRVIGFSVDVAREILAKHGYEFTIDKTMPWGRCLQSVETGTDYMMLLNAAYTEERTQTFFMSEPYYSLRLGYFYSKSAFPEGLELRNTADANNYTICGMLGYNYDYPGLDQEKVDQGAKTYAQVIAKLQKKRCDLFLEYYEAIAGLGLTGEDLLTGSDLDWKPLLDVEPDTYHIMVSRNYAEGRKLIELINQGIVELKASGKLETMKSRHQK